jgi:hypothetical protein
MRRGRAFYRRPINLITLHRILPMTLLRSLVVAVLAFAVTACGGSGPLLPETDADFAGTLTDFVVSDLSLNAGTRVLVEGDTPDERRIVSVQGDTRIYIVGGRGGQLVRAGVEDLAVGDRLQVWTTGIELRSYPAQVFAVRVHVIR